MNEFTEKWSLAARSSSIFWLGASCVWQGFAHAYAVSTESRVCAGCVGVCAGIRTHTERCVNLVASFLYINLMFYANIVCGGLGFCFGDMPDAVHRSHCEVIETNK